MKNFAKLLLISWAAILAGCTTKGTNWDIDAYAPVAETTLDLTKLIGDNNIQSMTDSALWLNVDADVFTFSIDTLADFSSFSNVYDYSWPYFTTSIPGGTALTPINIPITFANSSVSLREIKFNKGILTLNIRALNQQRIRFTYNIPAATKNGNPFTFTDTLPGLQPGQDTVRYSVDLDLSDYTLVTTGPANDQFNTFSPNIVLETIAGDPNTDLVYNALLFSLRSDLNNVELVYGKGYLGQFNLTQNQLDADLEMMRSFTSGAVDIEQLSLNLIIHNTIGADLRFKPMSLVVKNTNQNTTLSLIHPQMGQTANINRAFETGNPLNPVNATLYTYSFNSGNSNIESLVELLPDKIEFSGDAKLNPNGNLGGNTDFYYPGYPAKIQMQLQAPLKFKIDQLTFVDTLDNPFANLDIMDNVTDGEFIIRAENKFPLEMKLQVFTLDNQGAITDSVLVNDIITAALLNSFNRVENPVNTDLHAPVDAAKIYNLKNASKIKIKAMLNTLPSSSGRLQMYSDYYLKIKLIGDIKYHVVL